MDTIFLLRLVGGAVDDEYGAALLSVHDLDGDGLHDLVIGAPGADDGGVDAGAVYIIPGASSGYVDAASASVVFGDDAGDGFGRGLALGDVDGDGLYEVAVYADGCECVSVLSAADGFTERTTVAGTRGTDFGAALDFGDLDGDGFSDLLVGAPGDDAGGTDAGAVTVWHGSAEGLGDEADTTLLGVAAGDTFGTSVRSAGDVDADGDDELVVGAPAGGSTGAGAVYAWYGAPAGIGGSFDWSAEPSTQWDYGIGLTRGDFDADGYGDIAIAGHWLDGGLGAAAGSASGLGSVTDILRASGYAESVVTAPGADGDGDGDDDVPLQLRQSEACSTCGSVPSPSSRYSHALDLPEAVALAPAGDVVVGAHDEVWASVGGGAGVVYLAARVTDDDADRFPVGFGGALADCDDTDRSIHPLAWEREGDGVDSDCDGADGAATSTSPPVCRSVATPAQAKTLLDADQRVATDIPALLAEGEAAVQADAGYLEVSGDDGTDTWTRAGLAPEASATGTLLAIDRDQTWFTELGGICFADSAVSSTVAFAVDWPESTPSGLVHMSATRTSVEGADTYVGVGEWADGQRRAFAAEVRSGRTDADRLPLYEGLVEEGDGCAFEYEYRSEDGGLGAIWSFDDGLHTVEVSTGGSTTCAQGDWTVGRQDGGPWRPIDPTTWEPLGTRDEDGDGWPLDAGDCDDTDARLNPCAVETPGCADLNCDGRVEDSDGDGVADCADGAPDDPCLPRVREWYGGDDDGDGYGDVSLGFACLAPEDGASTERDCDDTEAMASPGGVEDCNGADDDCDGEVDEANTGRRYADSDRDGYGNARNPLPASLICEGSAVLDDCHDTDPTIWPGAPEVADDGIDQDCDGEDLRSPAPKPEPEPEAAGAGCFGGSAGAVVIGALANSLRRRARPGPSGPVTRSAPPE